MQSDGKSYPAQIENISFGGVLIRIGSDLQVGLKAGNKCVLKLFKDESGDYESTHLCEVVWVTLTKIGIRFIKLCL